MQMTARLPKLRYKLIYTILCIVRQWKWP